MSKSAIFVKFIPAISVLITLAMVFASCGAGNDMKSEAMYDSYKDIVSSGIHLDDMPMLEAETEAKMDFYYSLSGTPEVGNSVEVKDPLASRKIIKTVNIVSETKELDTALANIESIVAALGGYVQSSNTYGKSYEKYSNRRANYTVRIPAENLDAFMNGINGLMNITSKTEKVDDITDTYTDIEARLTTLKTEESRLIELLSKAEKLEDIIKLEDRISNVRYEIESYEARLRNYNTLIAFSTLNIEIAEVIDYTPEPIKDPSFGERIGKAFSESWKDFSENFKSFTVFLIYALPTLLVFTSISAIIVVIIVVSLKKSKKRKAAPVKNNNNEETK